MYLHLFSLEMGKMFRSKNDHKDNSMTSSLIQGEFDTMSLAEMESQLEDIVVVKNEVNRLQIGPLGNGDNGVDNNALRRSDEHNFSSLDLEMGNLKKSQVCRICLEGSKIIRRTGSSENLISPCRCTGTLGAIHQSCLEQWFSVSNSTKCEICRFVYLTTRSPPNFKDYLTDPGNAFVCRNLMTDILCFSLLTPVLLISIYLCFIGANKYYYEFSGTGHSVGLLALSAFLVLVYCIWLRVTHKYHTTVWRTWRATHPKVKLILVT